MNTSDGRRPATTDQQRNSLAEVARGAATRVLIEDGTPGAPDAGRVVAVGVDLVQVADFAELLLTPGSRFAAPGKVFTPREFRRAEGRAEQKGDGSPVHLATLWALKEATLKAWLSALAHSQTKPPLREQDVNWSQITVRHTASGVPSITLVGGMEKAFHTSLAGVLGPECERCSPDGRFAASASHDGLYALAVVTIKQCCV